MVIEGVRRGLTYRLAAARAGLHQDTITDWKAKHSDFSERLFVAEAEAAQEALDKIRKASDDDWRAAAWILEHRHPADFGKTVQETQHTGSAEAPVAIRLVRE
jgi:hypothetical protein